MADPLRLSQVLANLLTNAAKYTDAEGKISLRATCSVEAIEISVSDNGIGIPPEVLADVFAMFSQVKSSQDRSEGGLGIGLALAKGLVALHGGTIEAQSAGTGRGSEFIVRLPRKTIERRRPNDFVPKGGIQPQAQKILIADENRDAADSLAMLLRLDGHDVTVVHDGNRAIEAIRAERPDIAFLDIGMPKLNGYDVAQQVRQEFGATVRLIAVTGWGQTTDKERARAAGFDQHFTKPVEPERLSEILSARRKPATASPAET